LWAISSRNAPVPAAHFRFILKPDRRPSSAMWMTLVSWPPMSMTVILRGKW